MAKCQCCGQEIWKSKPRASKSPAKWLAEDVAKAEAAIDVLDVVVTRGTVYDLPDVKYERYLNDRVPTHEFALRPASAHFIEACQLEAERLRRALTEPELLWGIYRRKYAKAGAAYELTPVTPAA